ncbi:MAG: endonuclease MutS2 [Ruminococcaceae bacterium]|nr:endonuclease MutS2 [Oscillospiraceae bacterium]
MDKNLKALDFDKIVERLAEQTSCEDARELALNLMPEKTLDRAQHLLDYTNDAYVVLAKYGGPSFGGLKNVDNLLHVADAGGTLSMRDLLGVASTFRAIRVLYEWHKHCEGISTKLSKIFATLIPQKIIEKRIFQCILSEEEMWDHASKELNDIRKELRRQESKIREQLDHIIHSAHYQTALQDAIITMRNGRFVVPVKREYKNEVAGLVQDVSDSGATVFIEPMSVVEANNKIKELLGKEREEMERILAELSAEVGSTYETTKTSYAAAVKLNLIFAKANLAYAMKASVPLLNDEGIIDLKGARHPLIDPKKVVKTDIRLGEDFDTLIITGPNTGGKTVSIKTIGLLSIMAACGLMLPCADNSKMAIFENVFADIGDEQSIEQSLSTFSSHMKNIVEIISKAKTGTLVLIDELGAGTDPVEGAALATSILERLRKQGAITAATTHYAELKAYALQTDRVENGCCEFDINTLSPTYRLLIGVPGRSNAFAISERLGVPVEVVARARDLVSSENTKFEDVVSRLEESRAEMETENKRIKELSKDLEVTKKEAENLKESIENLKNEEIEKARLEAVKIVEKAKREAQDFLDEIEELKKEQKRSKNLVQLGANAKMTIRRHEESLNDITDPIVDLTKDEDYVLPRELEIGDTVVIADLGTTATVTALADKKGMVEVTSGIIKSRVDLSNLRLLDKAPKKKITGGTRKVRQVESRASMKVETEVDLRGMASDEAILALDRFIDLQVRSGIEKFTVIHGKGTGVLRKSVKQFLSKHPSVKEYRLGVFGEGEDGVTIVTLK